MALEQLIESNLEYSSLCAVTVLLTLKLCTDIGIQLTNKAAIGYGKKGPFAVIMLDRSLKLMTFVLHWKAY